MDNQQPTSAPEPLSAYPARAPKKKRSLFKLVALLVILLILFFIGKSIFGGSSKAKPISLTPTPTPTEFLFPTDTPEPSSSPTPTGTPTPTSSKSSSGSNAVDSKTGLDRSSVSVEILNGSGTVGVASKASDYLKGLGYKIASTGNADNFDYTETEVHVKASKSKFLPLIKSDLSSQYTISAATSDLDDSSSADIQVIVGKE